MLLVVANRTKYTNFQFKGIENIENYRKSIERLFTLFVMCTLKCKKIFLQMNSKTFSAERSDKLGIRKAAFRRLS